MARQTLVDWVEQERRSIVLRAQGKNKNIQQPTLPGQPPGAPGNPPPNPQPGQAVMTRPLGLTPPGQPMAGPAGMGPQQPQPPQKPAFGKQPQQLPMNGQPANGKMPPQPPSSAKPDKDGNFTAPNGAPVSPASKNAAEHVATHVQDPLGQTQEMFQNLQQSRLQYMQHQDEARRALLPVRAVLDHVSQLHQLEPNNPDTNMAYQDPNNPQPMGPGMKAPLPGQGGPGQNGDGNTGQVPPNMAGTPKLMDQNLPSQTGFQPGKAAGGDGQQVRPGKIGQPTPGGGEDPGKPSAKPPGKNGKPGNGKSIKIHVQGAWDRGVKPRVPSLDSMMAGVGLVTVKAQAQMPSTTSQTTPPPVTTVQSKKKKKLRAKAPEGWEDTVKKMKDHPEIDNPYALTNWMDEEGYTPGGADKKK